MWSEYSARKSAELVGLTESAVRGLVRAGVFGRSPDAVPARLGFRDLTLLRRVRRWRDGGVSMRRIRRELLAIRTRLPTLTDFAELAIDTHAGHLLVRDHLCAWRADNGQLVFRFESGDDATAITSLPERRAASAEAEAVADRSASEWFDRALGLEEEDPRGAIEAYRKVLEFRPDSVETLINLGRLHAESAAIDEAAECFERALEIDPNDATAYYNLGVVAQDAGDDERAVELYQQALGRDPRLAEAHYNLATIYDRTGEARNAIRHINEYRKLIRGD